MQTIKQTALDLDLNLKKTANVSSWRKRLAGLRWRKLLCCTTPKVTPTDRRLPWKRCCALISFNNGSAGRAQRWMTLIFDVPLHHEFAQLGKISRLPDKSTILWFLHWLERHKLADGILATVNDLLSRQDLLLKKSSVVDAMLIATLNSTKNKSGK